LITSALIPWTFNPYQPGILSVSLFSCYLQTATYSPVLLIVNVGSIDVSTVARWLLLLVPIAGHRWADMVILGGGAIVVAWLRIAS
jgi:hypothetical protein